MNEASNGTDAGPNDGWSEDGDPEGRNGGAEPEGVNGAGDPESGDGSDDPDPLVSRSERPADHVFGLRWLCGLSTDDPDPPRIVDAIGQFGIYLGVVAIVLAVVGLVAGSLDVQILARVSIFFALVLASVAMGLGVVYQVYVLRS